MGQIQFDVQGDIPVIAQPKSMACWATVTTMMMSWKQKQSFTIETAMDSLGSDFRKIFDDNTGLFPNRVQDLATASGMNIEYQKCETPDSILQLMQNYGPIGIIDNEVPSDSTPVFVHMRIIRGIYGDGTAAGTFLKIIDPDQGKTYDESFDVFASKYESMSQANGWNLQMVHFPTSNDTSGTSAGNNSTDSTNNSTSTDTSGSNTTNSSANNSTGSPADNSGNAPTDTTTAPSTGTDSGSTNSPSTDGSTDSSGGSN